MQCKTAQAQIATQDVLTSDVQGHLSGCANCQDFAQFTRRAVGDLHSWRHEAVSPDVALDLAGRLRITPRRTINWLQLGVAAAMVGILAVPVASVIGNSRQQAGQVTQTGSAAPQHYVRYDFEPKASGESKRKRVQEVWLSGTSVRTMNVVDMVETLHFMEGAKDVELRKVGNGPVTRVERSPNTPGAVASVSFPTEPKAIVRLLIPAAGGQEPEVSYTTTNNTDLSAPEAQCTTAIQRTTGTQLDIYRTAKGELVKIEGRKQGVLAYQYDFDTNFDARSMLDPVLFDKEK